MEARLNACQARGLHRCRPPVSLRVRPLTRKRNLPAFKPRLKTMDVIIGPLFWLIGTVIELIIWLLIIGAVLSWLVAFNVINTRNRFVAMFGDFVYRVTEPILRPIRRVLPVMGGIDLSPLAAILLLLFLQQVLLNLRYSFGA